MESKKEKIYQIMYEQYEKNSEVHYFEVESDVKELLLKTDFTPRIIHLPFEICKLDCEYENDLCLISNILLREYETCIQAVWFYIDKELEKDFCGVIGTLTLNKDLTYKDDNNESCVAYMKDTNKELPLTKEEKKILEKRQIVRNEEIRKLIGNFLNYLDSEDVEIINIDYRKSNPRYVEKKLAKGKIPRPLVHKVRLIGKSRIYLNNLKDDRGKINYAHSFWVRGHWRSLKHIKYKNNCSKIIWILPYIKGRGKLIKNSYLIKPI